MKKREIGVWIIVFTIFLAASLIGASTFQKNHFSALEKKFNEEEILKKFRENNESQKVVITIAEKSSGKSILTSAEFGLKKVGKEISKDKFVSEISYSEYEKLKRSEKIKKISLVKSYRIALQDSTGIINATSIWQRQVNEVNLTGIRQTVCIIDTGVNYSHPALGGCYGNNSQSSSCKVIGGWDFCSNSATCTSSEDSDPMDVQGHGTHVAGIASASGPINGVAPGSKIVMIKASNNTGTFWTSEIKLGIDWCINHASEFNISVISMSLGGDLFGSFCDEYNDGDLTDIYDDVDLVSSVNLAVRNNISVIAASGNDGYYNVISSPACIQNVTPITSSPKSDNSISLFANTWNDSSIMMLSAPGENINSSIKTGSYESWEGTSMATPHIAGAIALMNQYLRLKSMTKSPQEIEDILNATGKQIYDIPSGRYFSRVDIYSAIRSLCSDNRTNSSWQSFANITSCRTNDTLIANYSRIEYDANNCGFTENITYYLINESSCDYCTPVLVNQTSDWENVSILSNQDLINQTRNITQYDNNLCNETANTTWQEYRSISYDYCFPNWSSVQENNLIWYNDTNNCYGKTNLSADLLGRPINVSLNIEENKTEIFDNESNNSLVIELNFNLNNSSNLLSSLNISKQNNESNFSYMIIRGLNLSENNSWMKTIYIDKVLLSGLFCLIDSENVGLGNFSTYCNSSSSEKKLFCPGTTESYSCYDNGTKFKITGLRNSGVKEINLFCGDGICNNGETCSSCSTDCGSCPVQRSSGGGGGGGGSAIKDYLLTESEFSKGSSKSFSVGQKVNFILSGQNHSLELKKIGKDNISITVRSEPVNLTLLVGKEEKINLTSAEYYDFYIKLENITNGKANLTLKKVFEARPEFLEKGREHEVSSDKLNDENSPLDNQLLEFESIITGFVLIIVLITIIIYLKRKEFYSQKNNNNDGNEIKTSSKR